MTTSLAQIFDGAIADLQLLDHPFYKRWQVGGLDRSELTSYAEQYRFFEAMLPSFLEELSARLPEGVAKDLVEANRNDEVGPPSHLALFDQFASFYGANEVAMSPATTALLAAYANVLEQGCVEGLAGLLAYESQGAGIADSKAEGLSSFYGANEDALHFWHEHGSVEADHAAWTFEALEGMSPGVDQVACASREVAQAWWNFLNERELQGV